MNRKRGDRGEDPLFGNDDLSVADAHAEPHAEPHADAQADGGDGGADLGARGGPGTDRADRGDDGPSGADPVATDPFAQARELSDLRDKHLRLLAEFENYRRRVSKERADDRTRSQADLAKQLIDPLDDLSRFAHLDPRATDAAKVVEGAELVERKLLKLLGAAGLVVINPVDQTFDHNLHEAVGTEPALSPEDDHVIARVYQPGYVFNGQLLRPARVVVKQWSE
jgi:molecular chaperone GrpE